MAEPQTFKVSGLPRIENIDDGDLLLVSDSENEKYYTKQMTVGQLLGAFSRKVAEDPDIMAALSAAVAQAVGEEFVLNAIRDNAAGIYDLLTDGREDGAAEINAND